MAEGCQKQKKEDETVQDNKWIVIAISVMLILSALAGILAGVKDELDQ